MKDGWPGARQYSHPKHIFPPMDFFYTYTLLKQKSIEVDIVDLWCKNVSEKELLSNYDVFVTSANSNNLNETISWSQKIRSAGKMSIGVGQVIAHLKKRGVRAFDYFDAVFLGEFAQGLSLFLEDILGASSEISIDQNRDQFSKGIYQYISNPDSLPILKPSLFDEKAYAFNFPFHRGKSQKWAYILTAYGCPYLCLHCTDVVRKSVSTRYRKMSPEKIVEQIMAYRHAGIDSIVFEDDTLFCDRKHINSIIDLIIEKGLRFNWLASARPDELDLGLLRKMEKIGPGIIKSGLESGDPNILEKLRKTQDGIAWINDYKDVLKRVKEERIAVSFITLLMIGLPEKMEEDLTKTREIIQELETEYIQVHLFTEYPEIRLENSNKEGSVMQNLGHYIVYEEKNKDSRRFLIETEQKKMYQSFYLNLPYMVRHLVRYWRYYLRKENLMRNISTLKSYFLNRIEASS